MAITIKFATFLTALLVYVTHAAADHPLDGPWDAWLDVPGGKLRFQIVFESEAGALTGKLVNAGEQQQIPALQFDNNDLNIDIAHYDSTIDAHLDEVGNRLDGHWRKVRGTNKVATIPFHAQRSTQRQSGRAPKFGKFVGKWKVHFSSDEQPAVAVFRDGPHVSWGTFLTTTGDYRYLTPRVDAEQIELSCFDGAHAFLFRATLQTDGFLRGDFWSGDWWHETWTAKRDDEYNLPSALELTRWNDQIKLGDLVYSDLAGNSVSLDDPQFAGKARIIEIFGSWCPNCHDAAIYLTQLHNKYAKDGLSIVGLAFEVTGDPVRDAEQVRTYQQRHKVAYPCLLAGVSSKDKASEQIPLLDRVRSYPTTIFLDPSGNVRAVYTGFSGPATGEANEQLKQQFEQLIVEILGT